MSRKRDNEDPGFTLAPPPEVLPPADETRDVLAEVAKEANAPAPAAPPALPYVPLDVFCCTSGRKFDQTKSFARWAKSQGLVAMTIPEWREQWQKFQNRPV